MQLGGICLHKGDLEGCLNYNREAAAVRPKNAIAWANIGFVHMQLGETDKAIVALNKALKWDPTFLQAKVTLSTAQLTSGEIDDSIRLSEEVIEAQPTFAPAYNNLAIAWLEKGDKTKAKEYVEKAVEHGFDVAPEILKEIG